MTGKLKRFGDTIRADVNDDVLSAWRVPNRISAMRFRWSTGCSNPSPVWPQT